MSALVVIACDKRKAFAQGSTCAEAIHSFLAARWIASLALAMTVSIRARFGYLKIESN